MGGGGGVEVGELPPETAAISGSKTQCITQYNALAIGLPTANFFWTNPCSSNFDTSFADCGSKFPSPTPTPPTPR